MILIILTEEDPVGAVRGVFVRCAYLLVLVSVLFIKWFPDLGRYLHPWTWATVYCGVTTNKNSLGDMAMVSGLVLLWSLVDFQGYPGKGRQWKDVWPDLFVLGMCLWLLHLAQSATSVSCFVVGAFIFFASRLQWAKDNLGKLGWCCIGLIVFFMALATLPDFRGAIAGALGRDATLTGRTDIWAAALKIPTNPLLGHGFASTWLTPEGRAMAEELKIPHAHNGYLETYLHSGLFGVLLLLAVLYSAGRTARSNLLTGTISGNFFMAFFVSGVVYNFTEVAFNDGNIIEFGLWLTAALGGGLMAKIGADEEYFPTSLGAESGREDDEMRADRVHPYTATNDRTNPSP
jgi:O-antigen ligase